MSQEKLSPNQLRELLELGYQRFPVVYSARAQFKTGGDATALEGATAKLSFQLNNNPHELTGIRLANVYSVPEEWFTPVGLELLKRLDGEQTINTRLSQQNIVLDEALQKCVVGADGVHWHPFEIPYGFRGANNVTTDVRRLTSYELPSGEEDPSIQAVTVHATLVGWMYVKGPGATGPAPASTGFADAALRS